MMAVAKHAATAAHWFPGQYESLFSGHGARRMVLISEEEAGLRGFLVARAVDREWEIENVVVGVEFLRRGIASELMRTLIQRAETEAVSAIFLEVRESNLPARRLYEKHGFREVGRRRAYYTDPVEDSILYTLRLTS